MIPINKEEGIIMISYTDNVYADYWKRLYEKEGNEGINEKHRALIKKTFNNDIKYSIPIKGIISVDNINIDLKMALFNFNLYK